MDSATRKKIAKLVRMFGTTERGERANAWSAMARLLQNEGLSWTDVGNTIECNDLTESEMAEIFEAGVKEGIMRASGQQSNDHITLPTPLEMAEFCHQRPNQLKDSKQRDFVDDMLIYMRRGINLSRGRLGYLASIYIQIGGQIH
jgi:hypothetical protein